MLTAPELHGCYPALITPMRELQGELVVDKKLFFELIDKSIEAGCTGILIGGTTGQAATLTDGERVMLAVEGAEYARERAAKFGRAVQVIAAAGTNATHHALSHTRNIIREAEVDAILHVTGYYNNPPQEGLFRHFSKIADLCAENEMPMILYNVPSRTRSNLEASTTARLARHPAIIGIKEASGDFAQIHAVLRETDPGEFTVLCGEDEQIAAIMKMGGRGAVSAAAVRWPREFQRLTELMASGHIREAEKLQEALLPCIRAVFSVKNPIPLHHMFGTKLRLPLVELMELEPAIRNQALQLIQQAEEISAFPHVAEGPRKDFPEGWAALSKTIT